MKKIILIAAVVLMVGVGYRYLHLKPAVHEVAAHTDTIYYCPMHPYYTSDHPGNCPICGMKLVKRQQAQSQTKDAIADHAVVQLDGHQEQMIGIKTVIVSKKPLVKVVHTVGYVTTALELYQQQNAFVDAYLSYVTTFRDYRRIEKRRRNWETHRALQVKIMEAKNKLLSLGLNERDLMALQKVSWTSVWNQPKLQMFDKNTNYWVMAQIHESDLGYVEEGQEVAIEIPSYFEKTKGIVRSVGGLLDQASRTVNALVELTDYRGELVENMLVSLDIPVELNSQLLIPRDAVMDTGKRQVVFVKESEGHFAPREVMLASSSDDMVAIKSGLVEGEEIVSNGNFLLDSESRLQAAWKGGSHD